MFTAPPARARRRCRIHIVARINPLTVAQPANEHPRCHTVVAGCASIWPQARNRSAAAAETLDSHRTTVSASSALRTFAKRATGDILSRLAENQPPSNPDSLPDSSDPNGPCPRCARIASFSVCGSAEVTFRKDGSYVTGRGGLPGRIATQQVSILECNGCRDRIVVIEDQLVGGQRNGRAGTVTWEGIHWWCPESSFPRQSLVRCGRLLETKETTGWQDPRSSPPRRSSRSFWP